MEGVELNDAVSIDAASIDAASIKTTAAAASASKKRPRADCDAAFAYAKSAIFEAKMRKRVAEDGLRDGTVDAAAVEAADDDVARSMEKAALVAAMMSNKALEKAAKAASNAVAEYLEHYDDAEFKQTKQTLSINRKAAKTLAEAQCAAGTAIDYAIKIGGSNGTALPFFELPVFHARSTV